MKSDFNFMIFISNFLYVSQITEVFKKNITAIFNLDLSEIIYFENFCFRKLYKSLRPLRLKN